MRRSAAPSQMGSAAKRTKFCTPFLNQSQTISKVEVAKGSGIRGEPDGAKRSGSDPSKQDSAWSTGDILKLITDPTAPPLPPCDGFPLARIDNLCPIVEPGTDSEKNEKAPRTNRTPIDSKPNVPEESACTPTSLQQSSSSAKFFNVVWCKLSKKKHKTWEGDAILKVKGRSLHLFDLDGKEIGHSASYKSGQSEDLNEGQTIVIGSKEVEIMESIPPEKFTSGRCFQSTATEEELENVSSTTSKAINKPFVKPIKSGDGRDASAGLDVSKNQKTLAPPPLGSLVLPRPSETYQWHNNQSKLPVNDVYVDPFLCRQLRHHQKEGVSFLYKCILGMGGSLPASGMEGGAILADEMGLGKTIQCISLIWTLYKQGPFGGKPVLKRVLVAVPSSLVKNWLKEFKKWLTNERMQVFDVSPRNKVEDFVHLTNVPVMIISYDMLVRNVEVVRKIKFDLLICDEGHKLKNNSNKTAQLIKSLDIKRRIILTGTPVQNDLQELYNLVDFCSPNILGTSASFKHIYENPIVASRQPTATEEEVALGQTRAFELSRITSQLILRRTQEINNQYLPPKVDIVLFCSLTDLQLNLYNKLVNSKAIKNCMNRCPSSSSSSSLAQQQQLPQHLTCISALRKLCNHPELIFGDCRTSSDVACRVGSEEEELENSLYDGLLPIYPVGYDRLSVRDRLASGGKMAVLSNLLALFGGGNERNDCNKEKVVVVSNYTKTLDIIESLCKVKDYKFLRLDGNVVTSKRQELVDRFNNPIFDDYVFLLSTKAGGVGLNLIGASRLILYDIDWNPANDLQAMARIWRDGQRRRVYVYRLLSSGTIEERIYQRQVSKQGLSGVVVDSKSTDSKSLPTFSREQLKELFSPVASAGARGGVDGSLCITHEILGCSCCEEDAGVVTDEDDGKSESTRSCQLFVKVSKKNSGMDELLDWKHVPGPNPDLSHLDPLLEPLNLNGVTFAFHAESNFT